MKLTENINELAAALASAQTTIEPCFKDSKAGGVSKDGKQGKVWKYAKLEDMLETTFLVFPPLGLSVSFLMDDDNLYCMLLHKSGQYMTSKTRLAPKSTDLHAWGSDITYRKRYLLCSILALPVADENDDDGQKAMEHHKDRKLTQEGAKFTDEQPISPEQADVLRRAFEGYPDELEVVLGKYDIDSISKVKRNNFQKVHNYILSARLTLGER